MQRLTPKERAAYLLHDIFGAPFDEVAIVLDLHPATCRKLAERARRFVARNKVRHVPDEARQSELLAAFQSAIETGDTADLGRALRADADLRADSGGKAVAVRHVIESRPRVCAFVASVLSPAWRGMQASVGRINGALGLMVESDDALHASVSFAYDPEGRVRHVFIMRHPNKLAVLRSSSAMAGDNGFIRLR